MICRNTKRSRRVPRPRSPNDGAVRQMKLAIERIDELPLDQLQPLIEESVRDGFRLVRRLADEWEDGTNRFARPGEILLTARRAGRLVGICGLNVDPYVSDARIGRVRRLYVEVNERRRGVGKALVSAIIAEARRSFDLLRL